MACSFLGRWPQAKGPMYGQIDTYVLTVPWLCHGTSELHDWGCGAGFARRFVPSTVKYVGVDATTPSSVTFVSEFALDDLSRRAVECDALLLRHILENNPEDWRTILYNAIRSFRKKMAIVNFRPFVPTFQIVEVEQGDGYSIPYVHFAKQDIDELVFPYVVGELPFRTRTHSEYIWFLEKR